MANAKDSDLSSLLAASPGPAGCPDSDQARHCGSLSLRLLYEAEPRLGHPPAGAPTNLNELRLPVSLELEGSDSDTLSLSRRPGGSLALSSESPSASHWHWQAGP